MLTLQACGDSQDLQADTPVGFPAGGPQSPLDDGDGLLPGDGTSSPGLPGENPPGVGTLGPQGDSSLNIDERRYPLDSALGDIWGFRDQHYNVNFTLTNGKFVATATDVDGTTHNLLVPAKATAILYAEMHSPGDYFSFVTYSFSPFGAGGGVLDGNAYFDNAYVGYDADNSGNVEEHEKRPVLGGTIAFVGVLPDIELDFSVQLDNGRSATGHYTGLFDFTDRRLK